MRYAYCVLRSFRTAAGYHLLFYIRFMDGILMAQFHLVHSNHRPSPSAPPSGLSVSGAKGWHRRLQRLANSRPEFIALEHFPQKKLQYIEEDI
jgi:hypothetical protein